MKACSPCRVYFRNGPVKFSPVGPADLLEMVNLRPDARLVRYPEKIVYGFEKGIILITYVGDIHAVILRCHPAQLSQLLR